MIYSNDILIIDRLNLSDIEDFFDMQSDPDVMRFVKPTLTYEEAKEELTRFIEYYDNPEKFFYIWAIRSAVDKLFMGICGVYLNRNNDHELAVRLKKEYWGGGFGSQILHGLIKHSSEDFQIDELVAYIMADNIGSIRMTEKFMSFDKDLMINNRPEKKYVYRSYAKSSV